MTLGTHIITSFKTSLDRTLPLILSLSAKGRLVWQQHSPHILEQLWQYAILCRLNKPIGIMLLLWPTLWALWIAAEGFPNPWVLFVFVSGVMLMRSAGCVLNDCADRRFDVYVARTRDRPLASGKVSLAEALILAVVLVLMAFLLVLTMNLLTIQLSFVALFLAIIYPFMKRYTYLPQFVLGLAFGWAIPMSFAAQTGSIANIAWLLLVGNVLWSVTYDTMYAMVDREHDLKIGVKSTAILFDDADVLIIGIMQILTFLVFILIGQQLELGWLYYLGITTAAGMGAYHQYLIKDRVPERCFQAFLNNNWLGAAIFFGIFLHYYFY